MRHMLATESKQLRRILGRMERGEEVIEAFLSLAHERNVRSAWVTALGAFEWVELVEYDQVQRVYKAPRLFNSPCEILSLTGNVSFKDGSPFAHLHTTVSRETDNGIQVLGGHVVRGLVFACEFMVECCDDLALQRRYDAVTGLHLWTPELGSVSMSGMPSPRTNPSRPSEPTPMAPSASSGYPSNLPSSAGRATRPTPPPPYAAQVPPDSWGDEDPQIGDWLEHSQYGLCQIEHIASDGAWTVRLASGAFKTLRLDFFRASLRQTQGAERVFTLRPRRS